MGEVAAAGRLYHTLVRARVRAEWQYRTSFVLFVLSQVLIAALDLATIGVLFTNVDTLGGWTVLEVVVLYGVNGLAFGIADVFVSPVETVGDHIRLGTFDAFLLRPAPALLQLVASEFSLRRLGRMVQPAVALAIALPLAGPIWDPAALLLLVTAVLSGAAIYSALWVMAACVVFWTIESQEIGSSVTYGGKHLSDHPIDVFDAWVRRLVVFVVPLAFGAYLPTAVLLGKPLPLALPRAVAWAAPPVALLLGLLARAVWTFSLRHYRSTGS